MLLHQSHFLIPTEWKSQLGKLACFGDLSDAEEELLVVESAKEEVVFVVDTVATCRAAPLMDGAVLVCWLTVPPKGLAVLCHVPLVSCLSEACQIGRTRPRGFAASAVMLI